MQTKFIKSGNSAVIINQDDSKVWANLYVNVRGANDAREAAMMGDITMLSFKGKTMKAAEKWAAKQLAA